MKRLIAVILATALMMTGTIAYAAERAGAGASEYSVTQYSQEIPLASLSASPRAAAIEISTAAQLAKIGVDANYPLSGNYIQTADIDLSGYTNWTPIGRNSPYFTGTYDGQNRTIKGLKITGSNNNTGLFGVISGATIKNMVLQGANISGGNTVGGIVGYVNSTSMEALIENCVVNASTITATQQAGGIAGGSAGQLRIEKCSLNVSKVQATGSYAGGMIAYVNGVLNVAACDTDENTEIVSAGYSVGGIVGHCYKNITIKDCYNMAAASGTYSIAGIVAQIDPNTTSTITDCYNLGTITGNSSYYAGGILGYQYNTSTVVTIQGCYSAGKTSNSKGSPGGLVGLANGSLKGTGNYFTSATTMSYGLGSPAGNSTSGGFASQKVTDDVMKTTLPSSGYLLQTNGYPVLKNNRSGSGFNDTLPPVITGASQSTTASAYNKTISATVADTANTAAGEEISEVERVFCSTDKNATNGIACKKAALSDVWTSSSIAVAGTYYVIAYDNAGNRTCSDAVSVTNIIEDGRIKISSAAELAKIGTNASYPLNGSYVQIDNIDISAYTTNWTPIGTISAPFTGSYDGNGYGIENLNIDRPSSPKLDVGLFGTAKGATLSNIHIESGTIIGTDVVGGILGHAAGGKITVTRCSNKANVTGKTTGGNGYGSGSTGGIVGHLYSNVTGTISECFNLGTITGPASSFSGGITGLNYNSGVSIEKCYNKGLIVQPFCVGGITSWTQGPVKDCYNAGRIQQGSGSYVWAVAGYSALALTNCYYDQNVSNASDSKAKPLATAQMQGALFGLPTDYYNVRPSEYPYLINNQESLYKDSLAPIISDAAQNTTEFAKYKTISATILDTADIAAGETPSGISKVFCSTSKNALSGTDFTKSEVGDVWTSGSITKEGIYYVIAYDRAGNRAVSKAVSINNIDDGRIRISTAEELAKIGVDSKYPLNGNYVQVADIDIARYTSNWLPIGTKSAPFKGKYDGNGRAIYNLNINRKTGDVGLFGAATGGTVLTDIHVESGTISGTAVTGAVLGYGFAGSIMITKCSNKANVTIGTSGGSGYGGGGGGVVGQLYSDVTGSVSECYNTGKVTSMTNWSGGVVGLNYGTGVPISYCYNKGAATGNVAFGGVVGWTKSSVSNCYNAAPVKGGASLVGAVVGELYSTAASLYFDNQISVISKAIGNTSGGTGLNTAKMMGTLFGLSSSYYTVKPGEYPQLINNPETRVSDTVAPEVISAAQNKQELASSKTITATVIDRANEDVGEQVSGVMEVFCSTDINASEGIRFDRVPDSDQWISGAITEAGSYYVIAYDVAGNRGVSEAVEVTNVDSTGPHLENVKQLPENWSQSKRLTVKATDDNGVLRVFFSKDKEALTGLQFVKSARDIWGSSEIAEEGTYYIIAYDTLGNRSSIETNVSGIDVTPSVITSVKQSTEEWAQGKTINATVTDTQSGVKEVYAAQSADAKSGNAFTKAASGDVWTSGTVTTNSTYFVIAVDNAGNRSSVEFKTSKIDHTRPYIEKTWQTFENGGKQTLNAIVTDTGVGIDRVFYTEDKAATDGVRMTKAADSDKWSSAEVEGIGKSYYIVAYDKVGNRSISGIGQLDKEIPLYGYIGLVDQNTTVDIDGDGTADNEVNDLVDPKDVIDVSVPLNVMLSVVYAPIGEDQFYSGVGRVTNNSIYTPVQVDVVEFAKKEGQQSSVNLVPWGDPTVFADKGNDIALKLLCPAQTIGATEADVSLGAAIPLGTLAPEEYTKYEFKGQFNKEFARQHSQDTQPVTFKAIFKFTKAG